MRKLPVDLDDIVVAMEMEMTETENFFDLETGQVVAIPAEMFNPLGPDEDTGNLPEWMQELAPIVQAIENDNDRYVPIPPIESEEAYEDMRDFADNVDEPALSNRLNDALRGKGAFGRFRAVLEKNRALLDAWHEFRNENNKRRARQWLRELGIDPIPPASENPGLPG